MKKQITAVEWLEKIASRGFISPENFEQAKEMEKQQIVEAYENGYSDSDNTFELNKQYYNETFKKE